MLVLSVLVYLACHYRIFGFVSQAVAYEGAVRRRDEPPTRRPPALIGPRNSASCSASAQAFTVVGQFVWWFANAVEVVPTEDFPLTLGRSATRLAARSEASGRMNTGTTRFVVLVGLLFFGTLLARLVFGYWRLRMMGAAEGGMILLDGGWSENERRAGSGWRSGGSGGGKRARGPGERRRAKHNARAEGQAMKFAYWSREIAGWVLVLGGLFAFWSRTACS